MYNIAIAIANVGIQPPLYHTANMSINKIKTPRRPAQMMSLCDRVAIVDAFYNMVQRHELNVTTSPMICGMMMAIPSCVRGGIEDMS